MTFKVGSSKFWLVFCQTLNRCKWLALGASLVAVFYQFITFRENAPWLGQEAMVFYGDLNILYPFAQALVAVGFAILSFGFLFNKKHAHNQFALPLKRETLFTARFLAGALCSLAPIIATVAGGVICNLAKGVGMGIGDYARWGYPLRLMAGFVIQGLLCYAIAVVACLKAGNIIKAAVGGGALLAAPGLSLWGLHQLMVFFLPGYGHNAFYVLKFPFYIINPVTFFLNKSIAVNTYTGSKGWFDQGAEVLSPLWPIAAVLLAAALFLLCYKIFVAYRAEEVGQPEIGKRFLRWLSAGLSLGVVGFFLEQAIGNNTLVARQIPGMMLWGTCTAIALYVGAGFAFRLWDKKFRWVPSLLVTAFLPLVLAAMFAFALPGYAGRTPKVDRVSSVVVSYRGLSTFRELGYGYGDEDNGEMLLVTDQDIQIAMDLQKQLGEGTKKAMLSKTQITIIYTLKNGSTITRNFWRLDAESHRALMELDKTTAFDQMLRYRLGLPSQPASTQPGADYAFGHPWGDQMETTLSDGAELSLRLPDGRKVPLEMDAAQRARLAQTLYEELCAQTIEQRYFPTGMETVTLCIGVKDASYQMYAEQMVGVEPTGEPQPENPYDYGEDGYWVPQMTLALYPGQFDKTLALLTQACGPLPEQNREFVEAGYTTIRDYFRDPHFDYTPMHSVFFATGWGDGYHNTYQVGWSMLESVKKQNIAELFAHSTTQTSYAREGYLVWFARADGSFITRFVEKAVFERLNQ